MLKVTATIMHFGSFDQSLKTLNAQTRLRVREAITETANRVAADARALVPISGAASRKAKGRPGPGELRETIRVESSNDPKALVMYVKAGTGKLQRRSRAKATKGTTRRGTAASQALGVYAMAVEFGTPHRGVAAEPYLRPALDKNRTAHTTRVKAAMSRAARSVGGTP